LFSFNVVYRFAKEDAEREAKNKLKLEMDEYNDLWEEQKVKVCKPKLSKRRIVGEQIG
jgi:hypothetical protein